MCVCGGGSSRSVYSKELGSFEDLNALAVTFLNGFCPSKELGSFEGLNVSCDFLNGFCHTVSQTQYFQIFYPALIRLARRGLVIHRAGSC